MASTAGTKRTTIGKVKIANTVIDHRVQRGQLNQRKLDKIVSNYDPELLGVIQVSKRANGTFIVLDGWHRTEASKLAEDGVTEIDAQIHEGLTLAEEAHKFRMYNFRTPVHTTDTFRMLVLEGDEQAVRINDIVKLYGLEVGTSFNAIATALRITSWRDGFEIFEQALDVIDGAWSLSAATADNRIIEAIADMIYHFGEELSHEALVKRLKSSGVTIDTILEKADAYHKSTPNPGRKTRSIILVGLLPIYNRNVKKENQLMPYVSRHSRKAAEAATVEDGE